MGTNYYVAKNRCECCNRYDVEIHIGKSSIGWAFSFHGYPYMNLSSWKQYKEYLKNQTIVDEYNTVIAYDDFVEMIETYKSPDYVNPQNNNKNLCHNTEGKSGKFPWFNPERDWDDDLGYSFTTIDFS